MTNTAIPPSTDPLVFIIAFEGQFDIMGLLNVDSGDLKGSGKRIQ
jgi:hypothetical protein